MILKVEKIILKTVGGFDAEITGIDPSSSDCLNGTISGKSVMWDFYGKCRDNDTGCNFDTNTDVFQEIQGTLKAVVPTKYWN